jgi:iron only hydrogenase large subunit-like protein
MDYKHRIMVSLARAIKEGQVNKKKIIDTALGECLLESSDTEELKQRLSRYLDSLLEEHQGEVPLVRMFAQYCRNCDSLEERCVSNCPTQAIKKDSGGKKYIDHHLCIDCGFCVDSCLAGALIMRTEFARVAAMLYQEEETPVYAIMAPSFVGQFGPEATPQVLKAALKELGFTDVFEVAMAADVVTLHEAHEFVERMEGGSQFMITSCCCPVFIKLVEKVRPKVAHLVSPSVSPMIAMAKLLKKSEPGCRVVFIGPCIAKKNEALRPDLQPGVDSVLTYKETQALFEATDLDLSGSLGQEILSDASYDGRAYGATGGVTDAIRAAIKVISPNLEVRAVKGDGVKDCNRLLTEMEQGKLEGNFMEGMGCVGGCVGGPGCILPVEKGREQMLKFAREALVNRSYENDSAVDWEREFAQDGDFHSAKIHRDQK